VVESSVPTLVLGSMSAKMLVSRSLRAAAPGLWQYLKYRQYLRSGVGEREIHLMDRFVDPSRAALDIGVHLGMYTRHLARYAKSVIGFEANPDSARFAARSLRGVAEIHWAALSSQSGMGSLRIPLEGAKGAEDALGTLSGANNLGGIPCREVAVPLKRLDEFDLPPVGFIKIDVEGHEEEVLRGGDGLLQRCRPLYMIEVEDRYNFGSIARVCSIFGERDYFGFFYDGTRLRPIQEFDRDQFQAPTGQVFVNNFFFVPREARRNAQFGAIT
jgi:FkbM family methyltransferase